MWPRCSLSAEEYEAEKERREAAEAAEEERIIDTRRALARVAAAQNKQLRAELFLSNSRRVRTAHAVCSPVFRTAKTCD